VPSVNTKLAVHWAPSVTVCTPGWIVASSVGAQLVAAVAPAAPATAVPRASSWAASTAVVRARAEVNRRLLAGRV
jgi:hypothetical protein